MDTLIDLENGGLLENNGSKVSASCLKQERKTLVKSWSDFVRFDGSIKDENTVNSLHSFYTLDEISPSNVKPLTNKKIGEEAVGFIERNGKQLGNEKPTKKNSKKPPKPPRPPRPPSLDAADQKLIRELTELALMRKAKTERWKALKKMKASKTGSSTSNLFAMIITIFFCFVILIQGGYSNVRIHGSHSPTVASGPGSIPHAHYTGILTRTTQISGSPSIAEGVTHMEALLKVHTLSGEEQLLEMKDAFPTASV